MNWSRQLVASGSFHGEQAGAVGGSKDADAAGQKLPALLVKRCRSCPEPIALASLSAGTRRWLRKEGKGAVRGKGLLGWV